MGFFLPPKNLRNPEMLVGRKPIGAVEVDWSHPLARGLVSAVIPDCAHQGDLAAGTVIDLAASGVQYTHDSLNRSTAVGASPSTNQCLTGAKLPDLNGAKMSSFTIYRPNTLGTRASLWTGDGDIATPRSLCTGYGIASRIFAYLNTSTGFYTTESFDGFFVEGEWVSVGFGYDNPANLAYFYKNGSLIGSVAPTSTTTYSGNGYIGVQSPGTSNVWARESDLKCNFIWFDRLLTYEEHASLYRNPYQFLKPTGT